MRNAEKIYGENAERKFTPVDDVELRAELDADGKVRKISGYAVVYGKLSGNLGGYVEKIRAGALTKALRKSEARALFNHNPDLIVGKEGVNLVLTDKTRGLFMELTRAEMRSERFEQLASDIANGLITQQSFAFTVARNGQIWKNGDYEKNEPDLRIITEIDELFDVSPVTYPAYPDTTVAYRSRDAFFKSAANSGIKGAITRENEDIDNSLEEIMGELTL